MIFRDHRESVEELENASTSTEHIQSPRNRVAWEWALRKAKPTLIISGIGVYSNFVMTVIVEDNNLAELFNTSFTVSADQSFMADINLFVKQSCALVCARRTSR